MRKLLPVGEYTELNTNETDYLIQNLSVHALGIIVASVQPADTAESDFLIDFKNGISSNQIVGLCWGKPEGKVPIKIGLSEGA